MTVNAPRLCAFCKNSHHNPEMMCHARRGGDVGCTCECVPSECDCKCTSETPRGTPPVVNDDSHDEQIAELQTSLRLTLHMPLDNEINSRWVRLYDLLRAKHPDYDQRKIDKLARLIVWGRCE